MCRVRVCGECRVQAGGRGGMRGIGNEVWDGCGVLCVMACCKQKKGGCAR